MKSTATTIRLFRLVTMMMRIIPKWLALVQISVIGFDIFSYNFPHIGKCYNILRMKAMCIDSSKNFVWQDVPEPVCHGEFDVKIAIKACAVNRADLMQRQGIYAPPEGWPLWPGLECAGEVLECPPNGRFNVGDHVCALLGGGGYAERVVVPEGMVMPMPKYLSSLTFPSKAMLMRRIGISTLTAIKVVSMPKDEGLVRSYQGRVTFVTKTASLRQIGLIVPGVEFMLKQKIAQSINKP